MLHGTLRRRFQDGAVLLLILAVAALFRLWHIGSAPPALFGDEAVSGLDALEVLAGRGSVFFPTNYGREGLYMFLVAASFKLLGVTPLAIRLVSVVGGILTPLAVYWLGRELFHSERAKGQLAYVPLLAALWQATAYWAVSFSRFGERGSYTPLFGALTFAAFWRGVRLHEAPSTAQAGAPRARFLPSRWPYWAWFLLSGLFLGLSSHFYAAGRFYPLLFGVFLLAQAAVVWLQAPRSRAWARGSFLGSMFWPIAALFGVAAAVFAPLGWYFLAHPGSFFQRANAVSASNFSSPWLRIGQSLVANLAQFFLPGHGDVERVFNLPGRALLEPVSALLALLGLLICLRRWKRPTHLLLLLWWPILLLPAILAVDRFPTAYRALGVMPAFYFFPAIAVGTGVDWLRAQRLAPRLRRLLVALLLVAPLCVAAAWTARDYAQWATSPETYESYEGDAVEAAQWLRANPQPWPVYVSSDLYRHLSFMLLYSQTPTQDFFTYRDQAVRWFDGRSTLPLPPETQDATYLLTGRAQTPEEWLARYLPDRQLLHQSYMAEGKPSLLVYRAGYHDRREVQAGVTLVEGVTLTGYGIQGQAQPGSALQVSLQWRFAGPQPDRGAGYRVQVALLDDQGQEWARVEQSLDYRPQEWDAGSQAVSWYELLLPGEAPKAAYRLRVRLADGGTGEPLGEWAELAPVERVEQAPAQPLATFGETLRALDAGAHVQSAAGGEVVVAELTLDTTAVQPWSYTLFLHVLDANGQKVGQRDTATGSGLFPTDAWQPGQPIRDVYRIPLDVAGAPVPYRLALGFYDWRTGERLPAVGRSGVLLPDDRLLLEIP